MVMPSSFSDTSAPRRCWRYPSEKFIQLIAHSANTVKWHYNVVQYNMIFHTSLLWLRQSMNQSLNPQNTSHTTPYWASYGMYFVRILEKIDQVITAPHCIYTNWITDLSLHTFYFVQLFISADTHDAIITSLFRPIATLFWHNIDVIFASHVRWDMPIPTTLRVWRSIKTLSTCSILHSHLSSVITV